MLSAETISSVALAFDSLAADYDSTFTFSAVGRSQRDVVWKRIATTFPPRGHILELNCGTGEDALFMTQAGLSVTACDASPRMLDRARARFAIEKPNADVRFVTLPTEELHRLPEVKRFDGLFSNFAGLNCVSDLRKVAQEAAKRLKPAAPVLLCFLTRFCLWEMAYYLLTANPRKALRRCGGTSVARIGQFEFPVYYPTLSELKRIFAPEFRLVSTVGVGVAVPPSYLEAQIARHPRLFRWMEALDDRVRGWSGFRIIGDHMLLQLERVYP